MFLSVLARILTLNIRALLEGKMISASVNIIFLNCIDVKEQKKKKRKTLRKMFHNALEINCESPVRTSLAILNPP